MASLVGLLGQGPHYFGISLDQGIQTFLVFWTGFLTIGCDQGSTLEDTAANHFVIIHIHIYICILFLRACIHTYITIQIYIYIYIYIYLFIYIWLFIYTVFFSKIDFK